MAFFILDFSPFFGLVSMNLHVVEMSAAGRSKDAPAAGGEALVIRGAAGHFPVESRRIHFLRPRSHAQESIFVSPLFLPPRFLFSLPLRRLVFDRRRRHLEIGVFFFVVVVVLLIFHTDPDAYTVVRAGDKVFIATFVVVVD